VRFNLRKELPVEPQRIELTRAARPSLEALEARIAPGAVINSSNPFTGLRSDFTGGVLTIAPQGAGGHSLNIVHPTAGVGGLNAAEAHSGVVVWVPTARS
jgi:hypothetical protein